MKVLLSTMLFPPRIGGTETVNLLLARHLTLLGCELTVVTHTVDSERTCDESFPIVRAPSYSEHLALVGSHDVILQSGVSLRMVWPLLVHRTPTIFLHHTYIERVDGTVGPLEKLKRLVASRGVNVAVSEALRARHSLPCTVIPNPYDATRFTIDPSVARDRDLLYVGRLVSDKGVDTLLEALALLREEGFTPSLMIAGSGPEEFSLRTLVTRYGLSKQVSFNGDVRGDDLVSLYRSHRVLVVPSRWEEPFGVVALEGIACGCVVIGSARGGLPEAIGPCGVTFPNGDSTALASTMRSILQQEDLTRYLNPREAHLAPFHPERIAHRYLELLRTVV